MPATEAQPDDKIPVSYQYYWSPDATISIEEFVARYKPSMVQNDGTKPWIWVTRKRENNSLSAEDKAAIVDSAVFLKQVTERIEHIQNDASIPVRANKKAGTQSKKEVREQAQTEAAETLRDISKKYGFVGGKWLIFAPLDKVDVIWGKLSLSLVSGPLSSTSAFCAKVSTSPEHDVPGYKHVICVYMPDVYDKENVTAVMKVLVRQHGLTLSGVKSDLYTLIGLDSKHPSGIPPTVWKNVSLLKDSEIKELKEAYYTEQSTSMAKTTATADIARNSKSGKGKSKIFVKRRTADNPFVSDDETNSKDGK